MPFGVFSLSTIILPMLQKWVQREKYGFLSSIEVKNTSIRNLKQATGVFTELVSEYIKEFQGSGGLRWGLVHANQLYNPSQLMRTFNLILNSRFHLERALAIRHPTPLQRIHSPPISIHIRHWLCLSKASNPIHKRILYAYHVEHNGKEFMEIHVRHGIFSKEL